MGETFENTTNHTHQDGHCYYHDIDLPVFQAAFSSTGIRCCSFPATVTPDKTRQDTAFDARCSKVIRPFAHRDQPSL